MYVDFCSEVLLVWSSSEVDPLLVKASTGIASLLLLPLLLSALSLLSCLLRANASSFSSSLSGLASSFFSVAFSAALVAALRAALFSSIVDCTSSTLSTLVDFSTLPVSSDLPALFNLRSALLAAKDVLLTEEASDGASASSSEVPCALCLLLSLLSALLVARSFIPSSSDLDFSSSAGLTSLFSTSFSLPSCESLPFASSNKQKMTMF